MQTRVYVTCCLTLGKASVVGFSKQPLLSPHSMLASRGSRTSVCATTSHAISTAYTNGQQRDDRSKSTWSLVLSLCTIYLVAEITCMHVRTQSINNGASRLNQFVDHLMYLMMTVLENFTPCASWCRFEHMALTFPLNHK